MFVLFYFNFAIYRTLLDLLSNPLKMLFKLREFLISCMLSKVSYRKNAKWVNTTSIIIFTHINKESFFISKLFIVIHSTIYFNWLIYIHLSFFFKIINMSISLPRSPYEIGIFKFFILSRSPPISMFNYLLYNLIIVSKPYCKLLVKL